MILCREALRIKGLTLIIAIDFTKIFLSKNRIMQYLAVWAKCLLELLLVTKNKHRSANGNKNELYIKALSHLQPELQQKFSRGQ